MMDQQELQATLMRLPPAPWHSVGNTIRAGSQTIAHVTFSRPAIPASFIARMLAMLPDLLSHDEEVATLQSEVEKLREQVADLTERLAEVDDEKAGA